MASTTASLSGMSLRIGNAAAAARAGAARQQYQGPPGEEEDSVGDPHNEKHTRATRFWSSSGVGRSHGKLSSRRSRAPLGLSARGNSIAEQWSPGPNYRPGALLL